MKFAYESEDGLITTLHIKNYLYKIMMNTLKLNSINLWMTNILLAMWYTIVKGVTRIGGGDTQVIIQGSLVNRPVGGHEMCPKVRTTSLVQRVKIS